MQQLGKPSPEILSELKSALECNTAISDCLVELLETLQRDGKGDETLVSGVASLLEERKSSSAGTGTDDAARRRLALFTSALRQSNADEVVKQLKRLQAESVELP